MSAEVKHYKIIFHLAFVLPEAYLVLLYGSNWIWSIQLNFKSLKEGQGKAVEGYLSGQYVFVYSRTRSELLRDQDRLREWSMDLSKKNRAVAAVCVIVACLVDLMNDQVSFYKDCKERASQQICIGRLTNFKLTVWKAVVDRWRTFGNST